MNDFRSKILSGKPEKDSSLLSAKRPRNLQAGEESLVRVSVPRSEARTVNHRSGDRHRLIDQPVTARHGSDTYPVWLINLSGGGAMIEGDLRPELWDRVELDLGSGSTCGRLECAVRWIKGSRLGLEFAHETRIEADGETRRDLLRQVLAQNFPDLEVPVEVSAAVEEPAAEPVASEPEEPEAHSRREEARHPLIWNGVVHYDHDTTPVRLRNISSTGALIEGGPALPVGAELLLDLDDAGTCFATVSWVHGDQAGLSFRSLFNLANLARSKPQLTPNRWAKPDYLRDESSDTSPWASAWSRLSLPELKKTLGR
jgi:hypothetical protein